MYITAKSLDCDEVLDPDYTPSTEDEELFESKQVFMFSVFNTHLLTDMGKTIARRHVHNTDAQAVLEGLTRTHEKLFETGLRKEKIDSISHQYSPG